MTEARNGNDAERDAAFYIQRFLFLLRELAQLKIQPFSEKPILAERPPAPFNWSILPADLSYLGEAAERYSSLSTELDIVEWLDQSTEMDLLELNKLAQRMFDDDSKIRSWSEGFSDTQEAFHMNWLYLILDHAGID